MSKSNEKLCDEIQNGNLGSLEILLQQNTKLIYSLMNRFRYNKYEKEDLFSCAKLGLIKASKNFNKSFNCLFSTYAVPLILGEIKRYFRENSSLHISRSIKDLYREINKAQEILEAKNQKEATLQEISEYLNVSLEDILISCEANNQISSLDSYLNSDESICLMDTISSEDNLEIKRDLSLALEKLDKKERLIIELRYFQGFSQTEVANRLFLSQVQVSRLEKKILEKLKVML